MHRLCLPGIAASARCGDAPRDEYLVAVYLVIDLSATHLALHQGARNAGGTCLGRLFLAGQLERVDGLLQVFDRDSDGIGAYAFMVVAAGVLCDPALEVL